MLKYLILLTVCSIVHADTDLTPFEKSCGFTEVQGDKVFKSDGTYSYRKDFQAPPCQMGKCEQESHVFIKTGPRTKEFMAPGFETEGYKIAEIIQDNSITAREKELGVVKVDNKYAYYANGSYSERSAFIEGHNDTEYLYQNYCPSCQLNRNTFVNPFGTLKITP